MSKRPAQWNRRSFIRSGSMGLAVGAVGAAADAATPRKVERGEVLTTAGRIDSQQRCLVEAERRVPIAAQTQVLVCGGGPAGMEAARVLATRGHQVTLHEASDRLGGQLRLASKGTTRRNVIGVSDWLEAELGQLSVDIHLNSYVEEEDILSSAPDLIVVASGGLPHELEFSGAELATSSWDVLSGGARVSATRG